MKFKHFYFLLCFLLLSSFGFSQNNYTVKGVVKQANGYLPSGNVIALHPKDSTFIKGVSFFDGIFELNELSHKKLIIQFSSLEFDDTFMNVSNNNEDVIDIGTIEVKISGAALDEVVLKSRKPIYQQRTDGTLEISIENTSLSLSNSVNEILAKSPEILVDQTGSISVFGRGAAIIYLNGKRINDAQLALIAPSNIRAIEIIRNPSAKYDAEGAAVINITTITQNDNGYQVNLTQNVSHSDFGGTLSYSSLNLNYKKDKLSTQGFYTLQLGKEKEELHTTRDREPEDGFLKTDLTTTWNRELKNYSNYGLGIQYSNSDKSNISLDYSGFMEQLGGNQLSNNTITDLDGINFYKSDSDRDEKDINHNVSLNYNKNIDTLGSNFFAGGQYARFNIGNDNFIAEESTEQQVNTSRFLRNVLDLDIDIYSGQLDYTKVFKNENTLELGGKYSYVNNKFNFDFLVSEDGGNYQIDIDISNDFYYKESITAAYLSYKGKFSFNIDFAVGLRSEYTYYDLALSRMDTKINDNYISFFPNISVNKKFSEKFNLNFSYISRINRPPYQSLNPVLIYQDPYTSVQGNADLKPEKTHAFELNTTLRKTTFKFGYTYTKDPFGQTAIRGDEDNSYILKRINYGKSHVFLASASRTFRNSWWTSINTLNLRYTNLKESDLGFKRVKPRPNLYFYLNNIFNITNSFKAELLYWFLGDNYEGLHHRNNMSLVTASLQKSFFDDALKVMITANDIFNNRIASGNYNVGKTEVYYNRRWSYNYYKLSLVYNFGKLKKANYKNVSTGEEENERAQ